MTEKFLLPDSTGWDSFTDWMTDLSWIDNPCYGGNWDAFWDTITGLVELPEKIIFEHWSDLEESIPDEANSLKEMLNNFNKKYPMMKTEDVVDRITFIK
ncbi:hypothetical protein Y843_08530 [Listeria monocytogenes]|nr:hypothetical protein [Listeria monocytogenes]